MQEAGCDRPSALPTYIIDTFIVTALFSGSALFIFHLASLFPNALYDQNDIWFGGDLHRVFVNMLHINSDHYRTSVHPLFSILAWPATHFFINLGFTETAAINILVSFAGSASVTLVYLALRSIGLSVVDSVLVILAFLSSAGFVFFSGLAETPNFGALAASACILIAVRRPPLPIWIVGNAGTLAVSTTNWALGILTSFFGNNWWRFVVINFCALLAVVVLAILQKQLLPSSKLFFLPSSFSYEKRYIMLEPRMDKEFAKRAADRLTIFWLVAAAAPPAEMSADPLGDKTIVSNDRASFANFDKLGKVALLAWSLMLGIGLCGVAQAKAVQSISFPIVGYLLFESLLHVLYGDVPFLYSLNYLPALMMLCGFGFLSSGAIISRSASIVFILTAAISNYLALQKSLEVLGRVLTQ